MSPTYLPQRPRPVQGIHEEMIKDSIRTDTYRSAILAADLRDKVVLGMRLARVLFCVTVFDAPIELSRCFSWHDGLICGPIYGF
jgi:hypothetical protein